MKVTMTKRFIGVAVLAATACTNALAQAPASRTIKMQSSWPASNTLQEHFKIFAERVD
jgi:TRAP-type mannitol/chloroaromatic compound transport system substrate-binding protein